MSSSPKTVMPRLPAERLLQSAGRDGRSTFSRRPTSVRRLRRRGCAGRGAAHGGDARRAGFTKGYLVVCTYPEALAERVVDARALQRETMTVRVGDQISIAVLEDAPCGCELHACGFRLRAGAVLRARRYRRRLFLFGEQALPDRLFRRRGRLDPAFQHFEPAVGRQARAVEIIPNLNAGEATRVSLVAVRRVLRQLLVLRCRLRAARGQRPAAQGCSRTWRIPGRSTAC